jgi:predicted alpha/beta-hydrolase family hydrolase
MAELRITTLSISGHGGNPVPNRFFRQDGAARTLAVLFPGLWYTCDMPLLYYPLNLLLGHGAEVLQVRADYTVAAYQQRPAHERLAWLAADSQVAVQTAWAQGNYTHLVLVGKSIGTAALATVLPTLQEKTALAVWLTPLLHQPALVEAAARHKGPALFVAGTADDTYDAATLKNICQSTGAESLLLEGADHSLEVADDMPRSIQNMGQVMQTMDEFLKRYLK